MEGNDEAQRDGELLAAFENCKLTREEFTHRAHVQVGFLLVRECNAETALARMEAGLKALNVAHDTPVALDRGYHATITAAFLRLIRAACQKGTFRSSAVFCEANPELLDKRVLERFYSREVLMSWEAKRQVVEPDLLPLP